VKSRTKAEGPRDEYNAPEQWLIDIIRPAEGHWVSRMSMAWRVGLVLLVLVLLPLGTILIMAEMGVVSDLLRVLVLYLAVALALIAPVSKMAANVLVLRELAAINRFCSQIQRGQYDVRFGLGLERDDEHELLRLKRNMDWMARRIERDSISMRSRLEKTEARKKFFEEMSSRDSLTSLFNRRSFDRFLDNAMKKARQGVSLHLALLDCDAFKRVNDLNGHQAGDDVLRTLGRIIVESVRAEEDFPFRFGGDEFGVVFCGIGYSSCMAACERIRERFAAANAYDCTVSIGLASWSPEMGAEHSVLLSACDRALYQAKSVGCNRVVGDADFLPPQ